VPTEIVTAPLTTCAGAFGPNVSLLRRSLRRWLSEVLSDDPDVVDDLTLAASEALENAVDHAFVAAATVGTMSLRAADDGHCVTIVISDDGHWLPPDPDAGYRGRGIDLMDRLADISRVRPGVGGTSVTLVHHRLPAARAGGGQHAT
jgi:serine/threonine-protein kinase RsbW